ncbi:MAG: ATP synthase F1 subunit gamma [Deltaproteobacteria bacterium]
MSGKLKEVRERINSINSTQQITSAMKMVSASKLKKAQDAIVRLRPYALRLNKMLMNVLSNLEGDVNSKLGEQRDIKNVLLIVVTSNRGLCGAFNANILKKAEHLLDTELAENLSKGKVTLMCIGKKGLDYFQTHYPKTHIIKSYVNAFEKLDYDSTSAISGSLMNEFESGKYDLVKVAFARFKNAALQYPEIEQFLPVPKNQLKSGDTKSFKANYIFEPQKDQLLDTLIPSIMHTTFQRFLLDTHASEHGARMTAMENATENANELLVELKLEFNKARQEAITKELLEIISGASALTG